MPTSRLQRQIARKDSDKERLANRVIRQPGLLQEVLDGLESEEARVRYGCAKVLRNVSDKDPASLYPRMDFFAALLDSENKILVWEAIYVIANLARVDSRKRFEKIFDAYFKPITGPVMITAANAINGGARIATARPELTERITREILKVRKARYRTPECRRIALGHAVNAFDSFFDQIEDAAPVVRLVRSQRTSSRNATRKKAERFLRKHAGTAAGSKEGRAR